ncbi:hypothetical protein ETB97_002958 [Aspergillus alliaceus]|uniref:POT family-domain-containing protein n=1 Tax=Petromyces alliaceus TaxID=209559 RepID=A0A8H6A1W1_PETAA|nr:hypothetical protein ETB97_002958 [Aspergillus burnettii]
MMSSPGPTTEPTERTPLLSTSLDGAADEGTTSSITKPNDGLRRVADSLPLSVWLIAVIELCERFAFFGILGPMQNYIQNPRDDPLRPGGIGLGQAYATMINQGYLLWCYITPIVGAVVAEQYLGRVKTILHSSEIYIFGLIALFFSSLPAAHDLGVALLGLIMALFLIGMGTGGIKANVSSLLAEQYTGPKESTHVLKSGEEVIVDRDLTVQRKDIHNILHIDQFFLIGFMIILTSKDRYISQDPDSSIVFNACRVFWLGIKHKGDLDYARPSFRAEEESTPILPWNDTFVDDLRAAISSCKVFLLYPIYWAAYSQFLTNFVSQAATMETHGIPNDIMPNIDSLTVLILLPLVDRVIFPFLRSRGIPVRHVDRIVVGFILIGVSMLYVTFVQKAIYAAPPCYDHPRARECMGGKVPNQVSIFLQVPAYVLVALSEILASVAGIEYAYTQAPKSMKSLIMAIYLSTTSVGALIAMTVSPLTVDPKLPWLYSVLGMENFLAAAILWFVQI